MFDSRDCRLRFISLSSSDENAQGKNGNFGGENHSPPKGVYFHSRKIGLFA